MTTTKHRYWAIRTDPNNKSLLLKELREGRLRQGWGYDPSQDLQLIQSEIIKGGKWWERLSETQKEVLPHLRMLSSAQDSIQLGDWILVPNLPEDGYFLIAEVMGNYHYAPLTLSETDDYKDYGHILPVRLLTANGINKYADPERANLSSIRSTLRTPMRMWNLDYYGETIDQLLAEYQSGTDLSVAKSGKARLASAWEKALSHASDELRKQLLPALDSRFQAAEWEEPIKIALENLYPGTVVKWVAGAYEHGADVIVQIPNCFWGMPWLIVVQVKNYTGEIDSSVMSQLREAYDHYSRDGKLLALVVVTTAEKPSPDYSAAASKLSEELNIPVEIVVRDKLLNIMSEGLMTSMAKKVAQTVE